MKAVNTVETALLELLYSRRAAPSGGLGNSKPNLATEGRRRVLRLASRNSMRCKSSAVLAALVLCLWGWSAHAQVPNYGRVIKSTQNVGVLGKDLAGDSTNFHTGNTSFEAQDLALPGNNGLEVAVGRSYGVGFDRMRAARAHPSIPHEVQ